MAVLAALIAAVVGLGVAGVGPLAPVFFRPISPISIAANGGVEAIGIAPHPEGPAGVGFARTPADKTMRPLAQIEAYIPDPLPAPLNQWWCGLGANMAITFGNGTSVTYGPCYRPPAIENLWAKIMSVVSDGPKQS